MPFRYYTFRLAIDAEALLGIYRGELARLSVLSEQGVRVELAISHLRPFIQHHGIYGRFRLKTDENHRFLDLERLA
jgi:Protein of unknown function (DUF2835).